MSKKGNVQDIMFGAVMLVVIIISLAAFFPVWDTLAVDINSTLHERQADNLDKNRNAVPKVFNIAYVIIFFGAFISVIALAFFVQSSIIFFFISVIVLAIFTFISTVLANVYDDFINSSADILSYVNANFVLADHLIRNYPLYVVILGVMILISLFAKHQTNVGGGEP